MLERFKKFIIKDFAKKVGLREIKLPEVETFKMAFFVLSVQLLSG